MIRPADIRQYRTTRALPSPNHGTRPAGALIRYIILHATAGTDLGSESWMADPSSRVSAHLHIRRDGSSTRHVADERRAWHAGVGSWGGHTDINSVSLGIEIGNRNDGREPYTDAQYAEVARVLRHYLPQGIPRDHVLSHAQIAPGRKTDPLGWDWTRMWREVDGPAPGVYTPEQVAPRPPELARVAPIAPAMNLDLIEVPTIAHVEEIARVRGLTREQILAGVGVAERLAHGMLAHHGPELQALALRMLRNALADYLKTRPEAA